MKNFTTPSLLLAGLMVLANVANAETAPTTSDVPTKAGEASTMVKGNPNADPDSPMLNKSRSERKMEKEMKKAQRKQERDLSVMGQRGAQVGAEAGTPQISPAGNPSVFKGGTPQ